jgi:hypothetical protein
VQFQFGVSAGQNVGEFELKVFEGVERRVVVTPDESLMGETKQKKKSKNDSPVNGSLGLCKRCGKGEVYIIRLSNESLTNCIRLGGQAIPSKLCCTCCYS